MSASAVVRVQFKGAEYDVPRSFIDNDHPGGAEAILDYEGKDMTDAFEAVGHDQHARALLAKYRVSGGDAKDSSSAAAAASSSSAAGAASSGLLTPEERERLLKEHRRSWWHFRVTVFPYIVAGVVGVATYVLVAKRRAAGGKK